MTCPNCVADNAKTYLFCHNCGEPLTTAAVKICRDAERREKNMREIELTEAVATRLFKWSKLYLYAASGLLFLFGLLLGKGYFDIRGDIENAKRDVSAEVSSGKAQIDMSVQQAQADALAERQKLADIAKDAAALQVNVGKYKLVNDRIEKLQGDILRLQTQVVDLGTHRLRAYSLESTGPGGGTMTLGQIGCSKDKATTGIVSYCAEGSPAIFSSMTPDGRTRPVASFSDRGFQDISTSGRPPCNVATRGTIFVQKGAARQADSPLVCVKGSAEEYKWLKLSALAE